jgi:hypothetical protein
MATLIASPAFCFSATASEIHSSRRWLIGRWLSDRERTLKSWYFQGLEIPEDKKPRFAEVFGHMTYTVTTSTFRLRQGTFAASHRYSVASETESSVTITLLGPSESTEVTFYRAQADSLFIKAGSNLEYFKRVAA